MRSRPSLRRSTASLGFVLALALGAGLSASSRAFEGIKLVEPTAENITWSPHYRMTRASVLAVLGDLHRDPADAACERLAVDCGVAVCTVDWEQMSFVGPILKCNDRYRAAQHFDRTPDGPHADALAAGIAFISGAARDFTRHLAEARASTATASAESRKRLVAELAGILHATQDLYSHSNIADELDASLQEEAAALVVRAVTSTAEAAPALPERLAGAVKITAFSVSGGGDPPDKQAYTHDRHAKDGEKDGEGFKKAYALAEGTSRRVIAALLARAGGEKAAELLLGR